MSPCSQSGGRRLCGGISLHSGQSRSRKDKQKKHKLNIEKNRYAISLIVMFIQWKPVPDWSSYIIIIIGGFLAQVCWRINPGRYNNILVCTI